MRKRWQRGQRQIVNTRRGFFLFFCLFAGLLAGFWLTENFEMETNEI